MAGFRGRSVQGSGPDGEPPSPDDEQLAVGIGLPGACLACSDRAAPAAAPAWRAGRALPASILHRCGIIPHWLCAWLSAWLQHLIFSARARAHSAATLWHRLWPRAALLRAQSTCFMQLMSPDGSMTTLASAVIGWFHGAMRTKEPGILKVLKLAERGMDGIALPLYDPDRDRRAARTRLRPSRIEPDERRRRQCGRRGQFTVQRSDRSARFSPAWRVPSWRRAAPMHARPPQPREKWATACCPGSLNYVPKHTAPARVGACVGCQ